MAEVEVPLRAVDRSVASDYDEGYFVASQWTLMWRKFRRHTLAKVGGAVIALMAVLTIFAEFWSPYDIFERHNQYLHAPPQRIRIFRAGWFTAPYVYPLDVRTNRETFQREYRLALDHPAPIRFFVRGAPYKLLGLVPTDIRFFGVEEPALIHLFGTDQLGRDLWSRVLYAGRISLSIGLVGVIFSFILGCILGGISGYYGGTPDLIIQRVIEFLQNIPGIPLWMALSAAVPADWPAVRVYFGITIILSIINWTGLARVVRGKLLEVREEDFVMAAQIAGGSAAHTIRRHLLPSFMSYLIVNVTLAVPGTILGETVLSFLGIGLRPPAVSWGVLLQQAQNIRTVALHPWLMIPGLSVILAVLAFNFLGDGLRDAADPYHGR